MNFNLIDILIRTFHHLFFYVSDKDSGINRQCTMRTKTEKERWKCIKQS
jgi:hypothetical protein